MRDPRPRETAGDSRVMRGRDKEHARALLPGTTGPPAPMRIGLDVRRRLYLNHAGNVPDVDPSRGDVGCDERLHAALAEGGQGAIALGLLHLARKGPDDKARLRELARDAGDVGARASKYERFRILVGQEQIDQRVDALPRFHQVDHVIDVRVGLTEAGALHVHGVALKSVRERHNITREGGRDEVRSSLLWQCAEDGLEIVAKAEVKHGVGFVENDGGQLRGVDLAALESIAQATRRRDDNRRVRGERALLIEEARAAGDGCDANPQRRIKPSQLIGHLLRQFACRRQDQNARLSRADRRRRDDAEEVPHGQPDCQRFSRARLGGDAQIASFEGLVEHGLLHRGQRVVALRGKRRRKRRANHPCELGPDHDAPLSTHAPTESTTDARSSARRFALTRVWPAQVGSHRGRRGPRALLEDICPVDLTAVGSHRGRRGPRAIPLNRTTASGAATQWHPPHQRPTVPSIDRATGARHGALTARCRGRGLGQAGARFAKL